MATIAGTLLKGSGAAAVSTAIRVTMADSPYDGAGAVRCGVSETFTTHHSTGAYSFTLAQGGYRVNIPGTVEFTIDVPSGSGTYTLEDLAGTIVSVVRGDYPKFDTVAAAQAVVILGSRVDIVSDGRGRFSTFVRNPDFSGANDGIEGFIDANGTKFESLSRE